MEPLVNIVCFRNEITRKKDTLSITGESNWALVSTDQQVELQFYLIIEMLAETRL